MSTGATSDHIAHRDASHGGGCSKTWASMGQFGWSSMIWSMLSVAALQRSEEGSTLVSTGSHETCIGRRQPEIRRTKLLTYWFTLTSLAQKRKQTSSTVLTTFICRLSKPLMRKTKFSHRYRSTWWLQRWEARARINSLLGKNSRIPKTLNKI